MYPRVLFGQSRLVFDKQMVSITLNKVSLRVFDASMMLQFKFYERSAGATRTVSVLITGGWWRLRPPVWSPKGLNLNNNRFISTKSTTTTCWMHPQNPILPFHLKENSWTNNPTKWSGVWSPYQDICWFTLQTSQQQFIVVSGEDSALGGWKSVQFWVSIVCIVKKTTITNLVRSRWTRLKHVRQRETVPPVLGKVRTFFRRLLTSPTKRNRVWCVPMNYSFRWFLFSYIFCHLLSMLILQVIHTRSRRTHHLHIQVKGCKNCCFPCL